MDRAYIYSNGQDASPAKVEEIEMNHNVHQNNVQTETEGNQVVIENHFTPPSTTEGGFSEVVYKVDDIPPWYMCIVLGIQHYLTMFGGTITYPYLLAPQLCIGNSDPARGYIISTTFFVSGIATFLQATFGVRLPIVQGSSFAFLVPTLAILSLPQWKCPSEEFFSNSTDFERTEQWQIRIREVQGAIIGASLFEVALGCTGLLGFLLNWITPLAIVPTISLIGLSLFDLASSYASGHWGISALTVALMILFSQYLRNIDLPILSYNKTKKWHLKSFPFFKLFPVLLTIVLMWVLCTILTMTGAFSSTNKARTDLRLDTLHNSPWFRFPYPGQWGAPTFSTGAVFGILAGILASTVESIGDYYACARLSGAPPPPSHAMNRGICIEGICCVLAGLWGSGGGVTSYSENIGAIGITKVGSRRVIQVGACIMILFGMLGKFGALFVTIPEPIIGGIFCIMFAVVSGVGLSSVQYVDLNSTRNLFILGISLFLGLSLPRWISDNSEVIQTGSSILDQILIVLLSTSMFVGGFVGFFLDNTVPGTDEERGLLKWRQHGSSGNEDDTNDQQNCYSLPYISSSINKISFLKYLPISPSYNERRIAQKVANLKKNIFRRKSDKVSNTHI